MVRCLPLVLGATFASGPALAHAGGVHVGLDWWRAYSLDPYVVVPMLLVAGFYGAGLARLWRRAGRGRGVEGWRAGLEHLCFLARALALWWTALASARTSALGAATGIFLLFTTGLQDGLLGAILTFAPQPLYALYAEPPHPFGLGPLADQQLAGITMWILGGLIYLVAALVLAWRLLAPPTRTPVSLRA